MNGAGERAPPTDPPRFCTGCGRKLAVQVLPIGWTARCVGAARSRPATPSPRPDRHEPPASHQRSARAPMRPRRQPEHRTRRLAPLAGFRPVLFAGDRSRPGAPGCRGSPRSAVPRRRRAGRRRNRRRARPSRPAARIGAVCQAAHLDQPATRGYPPPLAVFEARSTRPPGSHGPHAACPMSASSTWDGDDRHQADDRFDGPSSTSSASSPARASGVADAGPRLDLHGKRAAPPRAGARGSPVENASRP